jgi:hypothetical protein
MPGRRAGKSPERAARFGQACQGARAARASEGFRQRPAPAARCKRADGEPYPPEPGGWETTDGTGRFGQAGDDESRGVHNDRPWHWR